MFAGGTSEKEAEEDVGADPRRPTFPLENIEDDPDPNEIPPEVDGATAPNIDGALGFEDVLPNENPVSVLAPAGSDVTVTFGATGDPSKLERTGVGLAIAA